MTRPALELRTATPDDVAAMHGVRMAVRENRLADPASIGKDAFLPFLASAGAWVVEVEGEIVGFAALDAANANVWALFVDPAAEGLGIGRALHERMMQWAIEQGLRRLWLTTDPGTRAAQFYQQLGWSEIERTEAGEIRFEREMIPTRIPQSPDRPPDSPLP